MISGVDATPYEQLRRELRDKPRTWLITGVAGFIGSNLLEDLLSMGQRVVGLDNFATGYQANLDDVLASPAVKNGGGTFRFVEGDIRELKACRKAMKGVDYVLHQAALGSVPRSIDDPVTSTTVNVDGFVNILQAARELNVKRVVYASTCAVYGDSPACPLTEDDLGSGALLSPYAATKLTNEVYAAVFQRTYGLQCVGLRYFNIFGPRQDPNGAYAAVIPRWIDKLLASEQCEILGDGETSRDFCHVSNVAQANILAATSDRSVGQSPVYNVASGRETSLNELYRMIRLGLVGHLPAIAVNHPRYGAFRDGDIRRSSADISRIRHQLQYEPSQSTAHGLGQALQWYVAQSAKSAPDTNDRAVAALA
jgi:UDP-N-acetylglucosamine/UDP-N-acetylgalactosamine 4-epimerase